MQRLTIVLHKFTSYFLSPILYKLWDLSPRDTIQIKMFRVAWNRLLLFRFFKYSILFKIAYSTFKILSFFFNMGVNGRTAEPRTSTVQDVTNGAATPTALLALDNATRLT